VYDSDEAHLSYLKNRRWACRAATRDDSAKIFNGPHLDEELIKNVRATLELGISPEEMLGQLAKIIDVIVVDLRTPEEE